MADQKDMTEEEAEYWDEYFTKHTPRCNPAKPGVFARHNAPVGTVRFFQMVENGFGDYTKEKYQQPDTTVEEIDTILRHK